VNIRTASSSEWTVGESRISAVNTWSCCLRTYNSTAYRQTDRWYQYNSDI